MGLWTDEPQHTNGASYEWLHSPAPTAPPAAGGQDQAPEPPKRRRGRFAAILAALTIAVAALTVGVVALVTDGDDAGDTQAVAPLASSGGATAENQINEIYDRVSPSVVSIEADEGGGAGATGSGFVVGADGTIVTNDHVVEGAVSVKVHFNDSAQGIAANVVGTDPSSDIAVLHVDPQDTPALKPLTFSDSKTVRVGDNVLAIGFPLGLDRTATAGIVSGLDRTIQAPNHFSIDNVIQTDAPINPGNSGGPLFDDRGRVIGINAQIATAGSQGNVGIGFAIPANTVKEVVPELERGQAVKHAYLGVSTGALTNGQAGAQIGDVTSGGPADQAGLRAGSTLTGAGGDVIVAVDGQVVTDPDDLAQLIGDHAPGDQATITYMRDGQRKTTSVTLDERPQQLPGSGTP